MGPNGKPDFIRACSPLHPMPSLSRSKPTGYPSTIPVRLLPAPYSMSQPIPGKMAPRGNRRIVFDQVRVERTDAIRECISEP